MKMLLGCTVQILHEQVNIDCRVICSINVKDNNNLFHAQ